MTEHQDQSITIHNSQQVEAAQVSLEGWTDNLNAV